LDSTRTFPIEQSCIPKISVSSLQLIEDTDGLFYGSTSLGGTSNGGTVFSLDAGLKPFVSFAPPFSSGKVSGTVSILGQGFSLTSTVSFNGTPAIPIVKSGTFLTAAVPSRATTGFVTVTNSNVPLKSNKKFRVIRQITGLNPTRDHHGCEPKADLASRNWREGSRLYCDFGHGANRNRARRGEDSKVHDHDSAWSCDKRNKSYCQLAGILSQATALSSEKSLPLRKRFQSKRNQFKPRAGSCLQIVTIETVVIAQAHFPVRTSALYQRARKSSFRNILPLSHLCGIICEHKHPVAQTNPNRLNILALWYAGYFHSPTPRPSPFLFGDGV